MRWENISPKDVMPAVSKLQTWFSIAYIHGHFEDTFSLLGMLTLSFWNMRGGNGKPTQPCHHPIRGKSFGSRKKCLNPSLTTRWSGKIWKRSARMWRNAGVTVGRLERCPQCCVSCGMVYGKGCLSCSEALLSQRLFQNFAPDECFVWPLDCTYRKIPEGLD